MRRCIGRSGSLGVSAGSSTATASAATRADGDQRWYSRADELEKPSVPISSSWKYDPCAVVEHDVALAGDLPDRR